MKRPAYDVMGLPTARTRIDDVAGRPLRISPLDVASFRVADPRSADGESDSELLADFADFMAGDDALLAGEIPAPDPIYRERLRRSLWRTFVMMRGFDGPGRH